jgi:hypothetical protein
VRHTDRDGWVRLLAEVGRYSLEAWAIEDQTPGNPAAKRKELDRMSAREFDTLAAEAIEALEEYRDRHTQVLTDKFARDVAARVENTSIWRWRWHGIEAYKGLIALLALIAVGTAIRFAGPLIVAEFYHQVEILVGPPPAEGRSAASESPVSSQPAGHQQQITHH